MSVNQNKGMTQEAGNATTTAHDATVTQDEWADLPELPTGDAFPRSYVEELRGREAKYRTRARDAETFLTDVGGRESVEQAVRYLDSLTEEDGQIRAWYSLGQSLGLGIREMQAVFDQDAASAATTIPDLDDDEDTPLTKGEVKAMFAQLQQEVLDTARAPIEQDRAERASAAIQAAIIAEQVPDDEKARYAIIAFADTYVDANESNPAVLASAIKKGKADWDNLVASQGESYARAKATQSSTAAPLNGGLTGGSEELPEPKNVKEATARLAAMLHQGRVAI